jgi:norsolorinic acid ketoreductase
MSELTYLITGSNRGIGKAILETLIITPHTTVIAAVRDVEKSTEDLNSVQIGEGSKLIIVKIDSLSENDPSYAVAELKSKYKIAKVDVLISNAGILKVMASTLETSAQDVRDHMEVNTIAPLNLIKAFKPLLETSPTPKFFVITAHLGSIADMENLPFPTFAYGASKAAANYLVRKIHFENPWLTSMAFNPGLVQSDMGNSAAVRLGLERAPVTLKESASSLVKIFGTTCRETSGTFIQFTGEPISW